MVLATIEKTTVHFVKLTVCSPNMHWYYRSDLQNLRIVFFCPIRIESHCATDPGQRWENNLVFEYYSNSSGRIQQGVSKKRLFKENGMNCSVCFRILNSKFFLIVYMKNGSYRLIPFLFPLVNCICTNFLLEHDKWLLNIREAYLYQYCSFF